VLLCCVFQTAVLIINWQNSHSKEKSPCKLTVAQLLSKFPYFSGTRRLITINGDPVLMFAPYGIGVLPTLRRNFIPPSSASN